MPEPTDRYDRLDALLADRRRAHQEKQEAEQGHALLRQQLEEARGRLDAARAAYHAACAAIDAMLAPMPACVRCGRDPCVCPRAGGRSSREGSFVKITAPPDAADPARLAEATAERAARLAGYEGEPCPKCGTRKQVRSGDVVVCEGCVPDADRQQQHHEVPQQSPEKTQGAVENTHESGQQQHHEVPPRARVVCTADDLFSVDAGELWGFDFLPGRLKKLADGGFVAEVLPHTQAQAARAREAVAAQGLGGAVVVLPAYEGRCGHCGRDVGAGHEPGCPYHVGPQTGKCSVCGHDRPCPGVAAVPGPKPKRQRKPKGGPVPPAPSETSPPPGRAHEWHAARGATCCRACGMVRRDDDAGACPGPAAPSGELFVREPERTPTAQEERQ